MSRHSVMSPQYFNPQSTVYAPVLIDFNNGTCGNRINTNTAPVYSTERLGSSCRKFSQSRRLSIHPYTRNLKSNYENNPSLRIMNNYEYVPSQPAMKPDLCNVTLSQNLSSLDVKDSDDFPAFSKELISRAPSRYDINISPVGQMIRTSTKLDIAESSSTSNRSYSHGQAEQLRRSRESTTFSMINEKLSKSPLNQIRDMYLRTRGCSSSNFSTARTTKKANLSVVHAIVRFRVKEYLCQLLLHSKMLMQNLISATQDNDPIAREDYASRIHNFYSIPCSLSCDYCDRLICHTSKSGNKMFTQNSSNIVRNSFRNVGPSVHLMPVSYNSSTTPKFLTNSDCAAESVLDEMPLANLPMLSPTSTALTINSPTRLNDDLSLWHSDDKIPSQILGLSEYIEEKPYFSDANESSGRKRYDSLTVVLKDNFDLESLYFSENQHIEESLDFQGLFDLPIPDYKLQDFSEFSLKDEHNFDNFLDSMESNHSLPLKPDSPIAN